MSAKPRVLVGRKLPPNIEARLRQDYDPIFNQNDVVYSKEQLLALAADVDAIIPCHTEHMSADVIAALPDRVKAICSFSVGTDHIDLVAAKNKGLIVTNTPDVLNDATAEIAMLLMLAASRRAFEGERSIRTDTWADWTAFDGLGLQITGKRLGIVGMGRVGRVLAKRARGFDMEIHYHNRRPLSDDEAQGAIFHESLEAMLPLCDVLSIHCPSNPDSKYLINRETLALLPEHAVLVNTARGAVVDDDALIEVLQQRKIFAAGLDVFNNEPAIDPRYRELDNCFLLPHIGSATRETRDAMGFRVLDNLDAVFVGKTPRDLLT